MKQTIVIDIDGVIATIDETYQFDNCELLPGTKEALEELSKKYNLIAFSARPSWDLVKTINWFKAKGIYDYFLQIQTGPKPVAVFYIDDRAIRHTSWEDTLAQIKAVKDE